MKQVLGFKCPHCQQGDIFKKGHFFSYSSMNEHCPNCNHQFSIEPGYFYGAMYVSYILTIIEGFGAYWIARLWISEPFNLSLFFIIAAVILALSPFNYKLARVLWIYMFQSPSKELPKKNGDTVPPENQTY